MREQLVQEASEVRLTEQEASLMVALHSEREQKDGATTLRDLAETLRISPAEAELLLAEVRARSVEHQAPEASETQLQVEQAPEARRRSRSFLARLVWVLGFGAVLFLIAFAVIRTMHIRAVEEPANAAPVAQVADVAEATPAPANQQPNLPFHTNHVDPFDQGTVSEFEVAVEIGDHTVYAMPNTSPNSLSQRKLDVQTRIEQSIFECLEFARSTIPQKPLELFTFAVRAPSGRWVTVDIPIKSHSGTLSDWMNSLEGGNAMKEQIRAALQEHWAEYGDPND